MSIRKMISKSYESAFRNATRNKCIIILVIIFEYLMIFEEHLIFLTKLKTWNNSLSVILSDWLVAVFSYLPNILFKKLNQCITFTTTDGNDNSVAYGICYLPRPIPIIIFLTCLLISSLLYMKENFAFKNIFNNSGKKDSFLNFIKSFCFNLIDFGIIKLLTLPLLYMSLNMGYSAVQLLANTINPVENAFILIFGGFVFIFVIIINLVVINNFSLIIQFQISYHYDRFFSYYYDLLLLVLKILIAIENMLYDFKVKHEMNYAIIILILSINVIVILNFIYGLLVGKVIFILNKTYNLCRISVVLFSSIFYLFFYFLYKSNGDIMNLIMIIICFIVNIVFTYYITEMISSRNEYNILNSENMVFVLIWLFNERAILKTDNNLNKFVTLSIKKVEEIKTYEPSSIVINKHVNNVLLLHKNKCKIDKCNICNIGSHDYHILVREMNRYLKRDIEIYKKKTYNRLTLDCYKLIKLLCLEDQIENKKIKLIQKTRASIGNNSSNLIVYNNLILYYGQINRDHLEMDRLYKANKTFDNINSSFIQVIDLLLDLTTKYEMDKSMDIIELAGEVNKTKIKICKNLDILYISRDTFKDDYGIILIKFIYEHIFNTKYKEELFGSLEGMDERLSYEFTNRKLLLLQYDPVYNNVTIMKAGKEFAHLRYKSIKNMFPKELANHGENLFIEKIKKNCSFSFEFEYLISFEKKYVNNLILKCQILPSISQNELILQCEYKIEHKNLILLENLNYVEANEDSHSYIANSSQDIAQYLFIEPNWLDSIKNNNKIKHLIMFSNFFNRNTLNYNIESAVTIRNINSAKNQSNFLQDNIIELLADEYEESSELTKLFKLSFAEYIERYSKIIGYLKDLPELSAIEDQVIMQNNLAEVQQLAEHNLVFYFSYEKKYTIKLDVNRVFMLYYLKKYDKYSTTIGSKFDKANDESQIEEIPVEFGSTTVSSFSTKSKYLQNNTYASKTMQNNMSLRRYTRITLIYNFILIIYCLVYMAIGIYNIEFFNDFYNVRNSMIKFRNRVYHTPLSILNSFDLINPYETKKSHQVSKLINTDIDINEFLFLEIEPKTQEMSDNFSVLQPYFYLLSDNPRLSLLLETNYNYKQISIQNDEYILQDKPLSFQDFCLIYLNNLKIISEGDSASKPLYIINIKDNKFILPEGITHIDNYTKIVYEMIINYNLYFKGLQDIEDELNDYHQAFLVKLTNYNIYFTIGLLILHLVLIVISVQIINYLYKVLRSNCILVDSLITKEFIKTFKTKMNILKILNGLYLENPVTTINTYKDSVKNKHKKDDNNGSTSPKQQRKQNSQHENKTFYVNELNCENVVAPLKSIFIFSYLAYYLIIITMFLILLNYMDTMKLLSIFMINNSALIKGTYSNFALLQMSIIKNETDSYLYTQLVDDQSNDFDGYIDMDLFNSFGYSSTNSRMRSSIPILNNNFKQTTVNLFKCKYLVDMINDNIFTSNYDDFGKDKVVSFITNTCLQLGMLDINMDQLYNDIRYSSLKLLKQYNSSSQDYNKMIDIYDSDEFRRLNYLLLLYYRPIQSYLLMNIYIPTILQSNDIFLVITMVYLILNIVLDVLLYLVIDFLIVKRSTKVNNNFNTLIECLKN
jgi:hypothetical protein